MRFMTEIKRIHVVFDIMLVHTKPCSLIRLKSATSDNIITNEVLCGLFKIDKCYS